MITNISTLADRLKGVTINGKEITTEELLNHIASEDKIEVNVSQVNLLSDKEIDELKTKVSGEGNSTGFVDGMKTGVERFVKTIRNKKALEFEGKIKYDDQGKIDFDATADHVFENYDSKILKEAKIEPEKQVTKLQAKLEEVEGSLKKVQSTFDSEKQEWEKQLQTKDSQVKQIKEDNYLYEKMPKVDFLTKKQQVTLFKADGWGVDFDEAGNDIPIYKGQPVKDKMEKIRSFDEVLTEYATSNKWNNSNPGRGIGDEGRGNKKTFKNKNEAYKHMESNSISPFSDEGKEILKDVG